MSPFFRAATRRIAQSVLAMTLGLGWCPGQSRAADVTAAAPATDDSLIAFISEQIRQGWRDAELTPSQTATDGEWCRRVYLDLIGRIPSIDELQRFLDDRAKDKKRRLVDRLLSSEYREDYARNWSGIWTNLLIGRGTNGDRQGLVNREGLETYLHNAFAQNKPYDALVRDLIGANGANTPGEPEFNGAVNFLLDNLQDKAASATAKTARIFLGVQVQCTQCHDHPFNTWKQDQFWGLNAFFRQARALRTFEDTRVVSARLEDEDFPGEGGNPETGEIYYERRNSTLVAVLEPTFVDGTKIKPSGYVADVNRRDELAALVVKSPEMPLALVNRMWAHFLGYGFTKPIDDMGPHNPASHPVLLQALADEFVRGGYDLRRLMRSIVLSEPYALSSRAGRHNQQDEPALGQKPYFSRFYLRPMRPEQLYDSLLTAAKTASSPPEERTRRKRQWLTQFTINFGTDENDEASTFNGTITQALLLMNGELTRWATSTKPDTFLGQLAAEPATDRAKINQLYLAALCRVPSREELNTAQQIWISHRGDTAAALQDIFWAVLNSNEFILNH